MSACILLAFNIISLQGGLQQFVWKIWNVETIFCEYPESRVRVYNKDIIVLFIITHPRELCKVVKHKSTYLEVFIAAPCQPAGEIENAY